jgi:hypothetical protein
MPHLVQILLPVYDNAGQRFPTDHYNEVRAKLTKTFGGLTAYTEHRPRAFGTAAAR